jgi:hypothetical protein
MNIAYFIYSGIIHEGDLFDTCIKSLQKVSNCQVVVVTPGLKNHEYLEKRNVKLIHIEEEDWNNRRLTCKVECTLILPEAIGVKYGDNILVLDADLFFIKDPFDIFEKEQFDFFYTTRNMTNEYVVNGGVWGYTYNEQSENLLKFQISNLNNPQWEPYVNARNSHVHDKDGLDWWGGQDFLCEMHHHRKNINNGGLGFNIKTIDAGPEYNWIHTGMSQNDQLDHIIKKKSHVLHFKGSSGKRWKDFGMDISQSNFYKKILDLI